MNKILNSHTSKGWDISGTSAFNMVQPKTFNRINNFAANYSIDAMNSTIDESKIEETMTILDVGCGIGTLSLYGNTKYKNAKFISTDFSPKMIECVNKFIGELSLTNIEAKVMDGQNLYEIKDNSIDYTFSIFGLIFFPDTLKGMKEMNRVLKPNGKTCILSYTENAFMPAVFQKTVNELLGNDSFKYCALSLSNKQLFESQLIEAGFKDIEIKEVCHTMEIQQVDDVLKHKANPAYLDCLDALPEEKRPLFDSHLIKVANELHDQKRNEKGKLELKTFAYIGIGTK